MIKVHDGNAEAAAGVGDQGLWISPSHDAVVVFFSTGTQLDESLGAWVGRQVCNREY